MNTARLATAMLAECKDKGQAARRVINDADAADVRVILRRMAKGAELRIRTARLNDTVVIARVDADIWNDDAATMRAKLTPP